MMVISVYDIRYKKVRLFRSSHRCIILINDVLGHSGPFFIDGPSVFFRMHPS